MFLLQHQLDDASGKICHIKAAKLSRLTSLANKRLDFTACKINSIVNQSVDQPVDDALYIVIGMTIHSGVNCLTHFTFALFNIM